MFIYKITNIVNNRIYIGQTITTLAKRWSQHTTSTKNSPMYNAFRKYGIENFKIEIICSALEPTYLNELEQYFIKYYNSMSPKGYNLTSGGNSAFSRSEESRKKQRNAMLGHTVSQETRKKISTTLIGRPGIRKGATHTDEAKIKISQAQTGRKLSDETKQKMSKTHKFRLALNSSRTPAQLQALKKNHEKSKGRIPWNKGLKKGNKT